MRSSDSNANYTLDRFRGSCVINIMRRYFVRLNIFALLAFLALSSSAAGQFYFGKNKVQYSHLDWYVLRTEHFNIYYYKDENNLAEMAAHSIEESYRLLETRFDMPLTRRVPLIIYSSPNYFDQTNVIPQLLPENVAGFTEFFKGRMVVPFDGSYHEFDRVLRHELVHVFMYAKMSRIARDHKKIKQYSPPLWFTEGIAEYWSGEWNSSGDMVVSDAVLSGRMFDEISIHSISGSYLMYKLGESMLHYMSEEYGEDKILILFENWWKFGSFRDVVHYTFGVPLKEIFAGWQYNLRKKYFPTIVDTEMPDRTADVLTQEGFSVKPHLVRLNLDDESDEDYLIYKANKLGYSGIYLQEMNGSNKTRALIKGERSPKFESLHLLESDISVNGRSQLAFASRHYERDVLYIYDLRERRIERKLDFEKIVVLQSPAWSPDGSRIVFTGARKDGQYDLYVFNLAEDSLTQLTDDIYWDSDAEFAPDGRSLVFASDRTTDGDEGPHNLFTLDLNSGELNQLTWGPHRDGTPSYSSDGRWILFRSTRHGVPNMYVLDSLGNLYRVGSFSAGILDPSFGPDDDRLIFSAYEKGGIRAYSIAFDDSLLVPMENEPTEHVAWVPRMISGRKTEANYSYSNEFSFDVAQSAVAYDAFYGSVGGFQVAYSDILGNHQYYFLLYNNSTVRSDFLSSFNVGLTYINREGRINVGGGVFHLFDEYYNRQDGYFDERQFGGLFLVSYPFSRFRRVELTSVFRKSERNFFLFDSTRHAILSTNFISYVKDNSLWDITGPLDGTRYNVTLGLTYDIRTGRSFAQIASVDFRKYIRLGRSSAFASRIFGFASTGEEPQRLYLGGSWSMRGYDRREFYGRKVALWSNELRFPLIDNLYIGFPLAKIGFSGIRGAIFWDTGNAWDDEFDRFFGSVGFGARVALGYMAVLRFDLARPTDYRKFAENWDFDFFFGWNF